MRLWPRRRPVEQPQPPRVDPTTIAVLEYDLLGIKPEPGSSAALAVSLRNLGTCYAHQPADITSYGDAGPNAICVRCGQHMVQDSRGRWVIAQDSGPAEGQHG
jgi:hypothetical protein